MGHTTIRMYTKQQREVLYRNIDAHNRALYQGLPVECEYGYTCVRCHTHTDIDSSFSNRGHDLICSHCAQELAHENNMTISEYVSKVLHTNKLNLI